jgi:hypothetical protein
MYVAAGLLLQLKLHAILFSTFNVLYFYISISHSVCAVPNMDVFYSCLVSYFPGMLLMLFSERLWDGSSWPCYYFDMPFHMRCIYIVL